MRFTQRTWRTRSIDISPLPNSIKRRKDLDKSPDWNAGFAAARHQAANLMGHFIIDETTIADGVDRMEELAEKCSDKILAMQDNGTRPD